MAPAARLNGPARRKISVETEGSFIDPSRVEIRDRLDIFDPI